MWRHSLLRITSSVSRLPSTTEPRKFTALAVHFALAAACLIGRPNLSAQTETDQNRQNAQRLQNPEGAATEVISELDYVLQPADLIKVVIFQEPDLEREVRLSGDGKISLPLLSEINLKGKTIGQAQEIIRDLYNKDILVNPQVTVTVIEYVKASVNVLGAVNNPGPVTIPPDHPLTLLDAIARAGGFSRLANRKRVLITRPTENHHTETSVINADDIMDSNNPDQHRLEKGDVIFVPERIL